MTPEERAEKILEIVGKDVDLWHPDLVAEHTETELKAIVASEIRDAVNDAVRENDDRWDALTDRMLDITYEAAYKKALADYKADGLEIALEQGRREGIEQFLNSHECELMLIKKGDVAYKKGLEDAAQIILDHTYECSRIATSVEQLVEKVRARATQVNAASLDQKARRSEALKELTDYDREIGI